MGSDGMPKGESNMFLYDASEKTGQPLTTHQHYDGTQRPWEFKRVWHLEPSLTDPDTVYAGAEDAALFKSVDGGKTWKELAARRRRDVSTHDCVGPCPSGSDLRGHFGCRHLPER
jgi:hypothetical protein